MVEYENSFIQSLPSKNGKIKMNIKYSTPDLCDAFPELVKAVEPIFFNYGGNSSFGGEIVTVKCFEDNSKVKELVDTDGHNKVMVVDAGGSMRRACFGDMLAAKAVNNGWQGILIYGCVRDVDITATMPIGIKAIGTHPMKTDKKGMGHINLAVHFGRVTFTPGDYIYADNNGVIISPSPLQLPD